MIGPSAPRTVLVAGQRYPMTTLDCGVCGTNGVFTIEKVSGPGEPSRFAGPCCIERERERRRG